MASANVLPSLSEIQNLTDIQDIQLLLQETVNQEKNLAEELEQLLKNREQMEIKLDIIDILPAKLKPIYKEATELSKRLSTTSSLAESVSRKVKDLDQVRVCILDAALRRFSDWLFVKTRLTDTIKKVDDIIDLKNCISGVQKAMAEVDFETVAGYLERYHPIDSSVLEASSRKVLIEVRDKFITLIRESLDKAIAEDNSKDIIRFCKLFKPMGLSSEGLQRYTQYLTRMCAINGEAIIREARSAQAPKIHKPLGHHEENKMSSVVAINKLFHGVATLIKDQTPLVESTFGEGSMLSVIKALQTQADVHGVKILNLFLEEFDVLKKVSALKNNRSIGMSAEMPIKDPRDIAEVLDEITLMCQATELFDKFLRKEAKASLTAQEKKQSAPAANVPTAKAAPSKTSDGLAHVSELNRKIQEIMDYYLTMEEYFMVESVQKAIRMDEIIGTGGRSSMVDHVFFVLQKSAQRAMLTENINALCAIVNLTNICLNRDFKEVLLKMLKDFMGRALRNESKMSGLVVLNNVEVASEYVLALKKELETTCDRLFAATTGPNEREKLRMCLAELTETSNSFKQVLQTQLEQVSSSITARLKPVLDTFNNSLTYEIMPSEYDGPDPFQKDIIYAVDFILKPYQPHLTTANYDSLIVINFIVLRLEHAILQKRFTQLGGIQLDKDLRSLIVYFSNTAHRTVRDKFARLTQMASLLNLEKVTEVLDYCGENSGHTWRLTPNEIKRVLALRIDFDPEAIKKIKL